MCPLRKTLNIRNVTTTMGVVLVPACLISSALAVDYTYTIPASGTSQWNAGTHWGGGTAPVSATTTTLIFTGTQVAGTSATADNDMVSGGNGFQLNKLTFSGAGPATGTAPIFNLTGNALEFISNGATTPTIALAGTGTVKTVVNISNNLVLTNNLAVSLATNLTGTLSGVISGSGSLSKSTGTSTLVLTNTANSFSGGVTLSNGSLTVANIGNTSNNSALGSNGTVNISTAGNAAQFTWTGSSETSNKTIRITNSTGNANLTAQTASQTLTLSNDVLLTNASAKTLTFNGSGGFSLNGSIIGSGVSNPATALTKSGAGRLTLTGTSGDFTGAVTVSQGEIYATTLGSTTSASSLGKGSTINLGGSANSGTLRLLGTSNETTDKTLNMSGTTGGATLTVTGATYTFNQNLGVTDTGNKTLTFSSSGANSGQGINFNGLIADASGSVISFRANGSGNATFALGNTANSFSGGVTVDGNTSGRTYILQAAVIGNSGANSSLGTNATINLGSSTAGSMNVLSYTGTAGETTNKVINFAGTGGDAGLDQSGTGLLKFTSNLSVSGTGAKTLNLRGSTAGTGEFAGNIVDGGGTVSLSKSGSGTWTLSGTNTYTGNTAVTSGTLVVNGSLANTSTTISATGTLKGSGTIGGSVDVQTGAFLSPGNSPGELTLNNGLVVSGSYIWELGALSTANPGSSWDRVTLTAGDVELIGATISLGLGLFSPSADSFWQTNQTWTGIINNTGAGTLIGSFGGIDNSSWLSLGSFSTASTGNDVNLVWTAVPEPATNLLAGLFLGATLLRRHRH